jgi:hypothetical protein
MLTTYQHESSFLSSMKIVLFSNTNTFVVGTTGIYSKHSTLIKKEKTEKNLSNYPMCIETMHV